MKVFPEMVLDEFVRLVNNELNNSIYQINVKHNDGLIISDIKGVFVKDCESKLPTLPYILVSIEAGTFTEKDRIIEASIYNLTLELKIPRQKELYRYYSRYAEAVSDVVSNNTVGEVWQYLEIVAIEGGKLVVRAEC